MDSAAEFVPESVPRSLAKGGVAVAGALVAFWILQKVSSRVEPAYMLGSFWIYLVHACDYCDTGYILFGASKAVRRLLIQMLTCC